MFKNSLQARFIVPVSTLIIVILLGGALVSSSIENRRIETELADQTEQRIQSVMQILGVTDALVMERTRSAMRLLIERGQALGPASLGQPVEVKGKTVPNLLLGGQEQANNYSLVDGVVKVAGGTATLFVKSGDEFVRVSTNVKKDNERATGTILDPKGKAIAAIRDGKAFYGLVDILGNPFLTGYEPIYDAQQQIIGIWYVGYKVDMAVLKDVIGKSRLLQTGFMAITDNSGKVRFHSDHASSEQVEAVLKDGSGMVVTKHEFPTWGFNVIAAYPRAEAEKIGRDRVLGIIITGIVSCIVLIGLMALLLRKMVLAPLGGEPTVATEAAARIAAGDLTANIRVAPGSERSMMAAIARMQDSLRSIVGSIHEGADALNRASHNMVSMSDRVSDGVSKQSDATSSIAATLEEITVSIRNVSDSALAANEMAASTGSLSSEGKTIVGQAVSEMKLGSNSVNRSAEMIAKLEEGSNNINAIVNVIKEIADQTNLLALNAAIEAARAGETGRGFAVVADEVRKLAERTASSTQEITAMIADVQEATVQAISGIEEGVSRVNESVEKAGLAGESMERIYNATSGVAQAVDEISHALKEQSTASEIIARNVEEVASMNEETTASVMSVVADAHRLQELAEQLKKTVGSFRI